MKRRLNYYFPLIILHKIISELIEYIQNQLGYPSRFRKILNKHPEIIHNDIKTPNMSACSDDIIEWHEWRNRGFTAKCNLIMHEKHRTYERYMPTIENIATINEIQGWQCDIQDICCLTSSKSDLRMFKTLHEFAKTNCCKFITDLTLENLKKICLGKTAESSKMQHFIPIPGIVIEFICPITEDHTILLQLNILQTK